MIAVAVTVAGCSSGLSALGQTAWAAFRPNASPLEARLNPNFQYLRVTVNGRVLFLALGNEESSSGGPIEIWYSAKKEVLKFQHGRLVGADGLTPEWRNVMLVGAPSWSDLAKSKHDVTWTRIRDVMPGYRYGVHDELSVRRIVTPRSTELKGVAPASLTWFEERMRTSVPEMALPPARYAVSFVGGKARVVYGEQCLSKDICFTWQRWSAKGPTKAVRQEAIADARR